MIEALEQKIAAQERELRQIEGEIERASASGDAAKTIALSRDHERVKSLLDALMAEWEATVKQGDQTQ